MTLAQKHPKDSYILEQEIGIVYKITNKIQFDPFHEKYKYLNAWDSCYIGCTCLLYTSPSPRDRG